MKLLAVVAISIVFFSNTAYSQGIDFEEGTFEEILAKAKKENKLVFMDCYTVWCGPCKVIAKKVFPQEKVGAFFNDNYISLTMDMEKGEGIELAQYYNIDSYPTLLFLDSDGEIMGRTRGSIDANRLVEEGKAALDKKE